MYLNYYRSFLSMLVYKNIQFSSKLVLIIISSCGHCSFAKQHIHPSQVYPCIHLHLHIHLSKLLFIFSVYASAQKHTIFKQISGNNYFKLWSLLFGKDDLYFTKKYNQESSGQPVDIITVFTGLADANRMLRLPRFVIMTWGIHIMLWCWCKANINCHTDWTRPPIHFDDHHVSADVLWLLSLYARKCNYHICTYWARQVT